MTQKLRAQIRESLGAILPITGIVLLLSFTISPLPMGTLGQFLVGAAFLVVGMGFFQLGVEMSLTPMGNEMGAHLTKRRSLPLMIGVAFIMGILITIAEPDLSVLAKQVPSIPDMTLILAVAVGVGIFLVVGFLRIIFQWRLSTTLLISYALVFGLGIFVSETYVPVAFDSGGVTTGPITVPFILALGFGIASVRSGKDAQNDGFGLVALGSAGPMLAVMILGMFFPGTVESSITELTNPATTHDMLRLFFEAIPHHIKEVSIALAPILVLFFIFQFTMLHLSSKRVKRMLVGLLYTLIGLVLFLTGVNVGFLPVGSFLGQSIGSTSYAWLLLPIGMVIGYFIVAAEPAVHVLNEQVEALTGGTISKRAMMNSLSIGVSVSVGLAMIRVLTGISVWWLLVPGYLIALGMTFFVPPVFTAIAFDSGGVASGAMAAAFLLPFTVGACQALGGNVMTDAFGAVAMVAMTPLLTIQGLGLIYKLQTKRAQKASIVEAPQADDDEIIDVEPDVES